MRVLVCGGRDFSDREAVWGLLDAIRQNEPMGTMVVIQGGATGADALAKEWGMAQADRIDSVVNVPADWDAHGRAAGPIRNQKMIDKYQPHMVLAFPGGAGTADMVRRAEKAGIPVIKALTIEPRVGPHP